MSNRVSIHGLTVSVENSKGSVRAGEGPNGSWKSVLNHDYGDVDGTVGADGDPLDVFLGPNPDSRGVFVVNQVGPDGAFDEHKVMLGFDGPEEAASAYLSNYEEGWTGLGSVAAMDVGGFVGWLHTGDLTLPAPDGGVNSIEAAGVRNRLALDDLTDVNGTGGGPMEDAILVGPGELGYEIVDAAPSGGMRRVNLLASPCNTPNENRRYFTMPFFRKSLARANAFLDAAPRYGESPHPRFDPQTKQFDTNPLREVWLMRQWYVDSAGNLCASVDVDPTTEQGSRVCTKMDRREKIGSSVRWNHKGLLDAKRSIPQAQLTDGTTVLYFDEPMADFVFPAVLDHVPNPAFTQAGVMLDAAELVPMLDATQPLTPSAVRAVPETTAAARDPAADAAEGDAVRKTAADPTTAKPRAAKAAAPKEKRNVKTAAELRADAALPENEGVRQTLLDAAEALEAQGAVPTVDQLVDAAVQRLAPELANANKAAQYIDTAAQREAQQAEQARVTAIVDSVIDGTHPDVARFTSPEVRQKLVGKVKGKTTEAEASQALLDAIEHQDELDAIAHQVRQGLSDSTAAGGTGGATTQNGEHRAAVVKIEDADKRVQGFVDSVSREIDRALPRFGIKPDPLLRKANQAKVDGIVGPIEKRMGAQALVDSVDYMTAPKDKKDLSVARSAARGMVDAGMLPGDMPMTDAVLSTGNILQQPIVVPLVLRPFYQNLQVLKYMGGFGPDSTFREGATPGFDGGRVGGVSRLGRLFKFQSRYFTRPQHSTGGRSRNSLRVAENAGIPRSLMQNTWQGFNTSRRAMAFGMTKDVQVYTATGATPFDLLGENIAENIAFFARETDNLGYFEMVSATLEINCKQVAAVETVDPSNITNGAVQDGIAYGDGTRSNALDYSPDQYPPQGVVAIAQPNCEGTITKDMAGHLVGAQRLADSGFVPSASAAVRTPLVPPREVVQVDYRNQETTTIVNPITVKLGATILVEGYLTEDMEIGSYGANQADYAVDFVHGKIVFSAHAGVSHATTTLTLFYSYATNFALTQVNFGSAGYPGTVTERVYLDTVFMNGRTIQANMGSHPNYMPPDVVLGSELVSALVTRSDIFDKLKSPTGTNLINPTGQTYAEYANLLYDQTNAPSILGNDAFLEFSNEFAKFAIDDALHAEGGFPGYDNSTNQNLVVARTEYIMNQFDTFCTPLAMDKNGKVFNSPSKIHILY